MAHSSPKLAFVTVSARRARGYDRFGVDIRATHDIDGCREVDGFMFATGRRIFARDANDATGAPPRARLLISASFDAFRIARGTPARS
jgi:hypothetical protein